MAIDLAALWDFGDPAASEERFWAAMQGAAPDDQLILKTQIARTYGLRKEFEKAKALLAEVESESSSAGPEVKVRLLLELGRTEASATGSGDLALAAEQYQAAADLAKASGLDGLAVDALHMMAFAHQAPADQLHWGQQALELCLGSPQPEAKAWEGSLRSNIGFALMELGRFDEALSEFEKCRDIRRLEGKIPGEQAANWFIGKTLRLMGRLDEAEAAQTALKAEIAAEGRPTPYQDEELAEIARARSGSSTGKFA